MASRFEDLVCETMYKAPGAGAGSRGHFTPDETAELKSLSRGRSWHRVSDTQFVIAVREWDDSDDGDRPQALNLVVSKVRSGRGSRYHAYLEHEDMSTGASKTDDSSALDSHEFAGTSDVRALRELVKHRLGSAG